jgi:hypothetical protein
LTRGKQTTDKTKDITDQIKDFDLQEVSDQIAEFGEQMRTEGTRVADQALSRVRELNINTNTIPDAFENFPKPISPKVHAWLDVGVTGYFLGLGAWFATQGRKGPAIAAFVNAGMVAGVSLLTDYEGNGKKPISFKLHGTLDAAQAATAALGPVLHGFADEPASAFFYGQAANEVGVIALTDWNEGMRGRNRRRSAA